MDFTRKSKSDAQPVDQPDNLNCLVSGADCRLVAFESISEAMRLWIKGRNSTVACLLGDTYKGQADKYVGGALHIPACTSRLSSLPFSRGWHHRPNDLHGGYYTVNVNTFFFSLPFV